LGIKGQHATPRPQQALSEKYVDKIELWPEVITIDFKTLFS